jgi:hypothetical protein
VAGAVSVIGVFAFLKLVLSVRPRACANEPQN